MEPSPEIGRLNKIRKLPQGNVIDGGAGYSTHFRMDNR